MNDKKPKYTRKAPVTLTTLKIAEGKPVNLLIMGAIHTSAPSEQTNAETGKKETKTVQLMNVVDIDGNGELQQIVVGSVLESTLNEHFPNEAYVNKAFEITKLPAKGSGAKKYHPYTIWELEQAK